MKRQQMRKNLTIKQIVKSVVSLLSLCFFFILVIWSGAKIRGLSDQRAAKRWDAEGEAAQVSCYFAEGVIIDEMQIMGFEKQFEQQLKENLPQEETKEINSRRLYVDAYSSIGTITVTSEKGKLENAKAVGIGGDFFMFHPLQLLSGQYFSGSDLMKDFLIVDEDAAWQLFGSNDIAGKSVMIAGVPHYIAGVVKRPEGKFAESAGLDKTVVYVSYETLNTYGNSGGISNYEIIAPNPVKHFVYTAVKEKLGVAETDMVVVENSSRYSVEALLGVILDFGTRSMQHAAVKFPYWENIGRGYEDVMALVLLLEFVLLLIPAIHSTGYLIYRWKNKTWRWKEILYHLEDGKDALFEKIRKQRSEKKQKEQNKKQKYEC